MPIVASSRATPAVRSTRFIRPSVTTTCTGWLLEFVTVSCRSIGGHQYGIGRNGNRARVGSARTINKTHGLQRVQIDLGNRLALRIRDQKSFLVGSDCHVQREIAGANRCLQRKVVEIEDQKLVP